MNQLTPEQALNILGQATEPQNIPKLARVDFVNINNSLLILDAALKELAALKEAAKVAQEQAGKP